MQMKRCPSCGNLVPRGRGFKSDRRYCNYACYRNKTPKMVEVEEQFGKPLKEVIIETLNRTDSPTVTAELLGTYKAQLYQWMEKLGIRKVSYWTGD